MHEYVVYIAGGSKCRLYVKLFGVMLFHAFQSCKEDTCLHKFFSSEISQRSLLFFKYSPFFYTFLVDSIKILLTSRNVRTGRKHKNANLWNEMYSKFRARTDAFRYAMFHRPAKLSSRDSIFYAQSPRIYCSAFRNFHFPRKEPFSGYGPRINRSNEHRWGEIAQRWRRFWKHSDGIEAERERGEGRC